MRSFPESRLERLLPYLLVAFVAALCQCENSMGETTTRTGSSGLPAGEHTSYRDEKVAQLRRALALRPSDPNNITLEFEIANLLSQYSNIHENANPNVLEALPLYVALVEKYDHRMYYSIEPGTSSGSPELMHPRAAILAASILRGARHDSVESRRYLLIAMDDIAWTYSHRVSDWLAEAKPAEPSPELLEFDPRERARYQSRLACWDKRKIRAEHGDVDLGDADHLIQAAVRQYGLSYGSQRPLEVGAIMQEIIDRYPNTPLAAEASRHMKIAKAMLIDDMQSASQVNNFRSREATGVSSHAGRVPIALRWCLISLLVGFVIVGMSLLWLKKPSQNVSRSSFRYHNSAHAS